MGPPVYNIIISRALRVGPDILYLLGTGGYIILLLAVHYGWAQIGPPVNNIIIGHTLQVGPDILYLLGTGGPTNI